MRTFILIGFFVIIHTTVFSQEYISGKVVDINGEPISSAFIRLQSSRNEQDGQVSVSALSNTNGEFSILKLENIEMTMSVSFFGYETVTINDINTIFLPITITLIKSSTNFRELSPAKPKRNNDFGSMGSLQVDVLNHSFNNFESILGRENIDNLNKLGGIISFDYALWYRKFYFAFNHGHVSNNNVGLDSANTLKGDYRKLLLGAHFGYNIINSERFMITPKIGLKWYRYRMLNYDSERRIPMGQYVIERDLDIRFNHLIGFTGLNFIYKYPIKNYPSFTMGVGLYGGYAFKLNDKTWVYSRNNRLTTDHKMDFGNFNFGLSFSMILD